MEFDRVRNDAQRKIRVEQIKQAAIKLFDTEPFHEIDLAKIAKQTTFTRGNLYKYISSKEDIFLLVLLDELKDWIGDLGRNFTADMSDDPESFSRKWAQIAHGHPRFLKLISMLFTVIERNVSLDKLVSFKKEFAAETAALNQVIQVVFPKWDERSVDRFVRMQTHYVIGLFPYTSPTTIQKQAMEQLDAGYEPIDFVDDFAGFIGLTIGALHRGSF